MSASNEAYQLDGPDLIDREQVKKITGLSTAQLRIAIMCRGFPKPVYDFEIWDEHLVYGWVYERDNPWDGQPLPF